MSVKDRIRVHETRLLSDNWYVLRTTTFDWKRRDGTWQTQHREHYDRGNGAVLLPYNLAQRTVLLVKQFRYPAFVNGHDDLLIEAAAGLLDDAEPEVSHPRRGRGGAGLQAGRGEQGVRGFHEPGLGDRDPALLRGRIRRRDAHRRRRRPPRRGRGHRGAGAPDRRSPGHDRRRPHPRRQDHHAAAARGADGVSGGRGAS